MRTGRSVPEGTGERGAAPGDARPHGADRDTERIGDLLIVEVAEVTQDNRGAEVRGQVSERGVDVEALHHALVDRARAVVGFGDFVDGGRPAGAPAGLVERSI